MYLSFEDSFGIADVGTRATSHCTLLGLDNVFGARLDVRTNVHHGDCELQHSNQIFQACVAHLGYVRKAGNRSYSAMESREIQSIDINTQ